jgi:hypothetical protein
MKTIIVPTDGWEDWECEAFEQYVQDVSNEYQTNLTVIMATDKHFEIEMEGEEPLVEWIILNANNEAKVLKG